MTVQSVRNTVSLNGKLSRSHVAAGEAVRAMLAAVRDSLLAKNVAPHIEQSDVDQARQAAEQRRESMSWELHVLCAGDGVNGRNTRT